MALMTALVPDTNVFLHYKPVKDIDWRALASGTDVTIVVCLQVVKELDEKKDHPDLGDRAKRAIHEIRSLRAAGGAVREGVRLEIYNEEIRLDLLPPHMSPDSADDRIVYQAKQYAKGHPSDDVVVLSEDLGMELRCAASDVRAIAPDPNDRLPNPGSELKKQNRQLTNELATLQNRLPKLRVYARGGIDGEDEFTMELRRPTPLDPKEETARQRAAHPRLHPRSNDPLAFAVSFDMNEIGAHEYARYNKELEDYFANYETSVPLRSTYLDTRARSFAFELVLDNDGTSPADDIDVYVHVAADVIESVTRDDENDLEIPPSPPLPKKPSSAVARMMEGPHLGDFSLSHLDALRPQVKHDGVQFARVDATKDEFVIRINVGRLKHTFEIPLGTFRARFRSWEDIRPVQIRCTMAAGNHPKSIEHTLLLRIRRGPDEGGEQCHRVTESLERKEFVSTRIPSRDRPTTIRTDVHCRADDPLWEIGRRMEGG